MGAIALLPPVLAPPFVDEPPVETSEPLPPVAPATLGEGVPLQPKKKAEQQTTQNGCGTSLLIFT
jgi:hypothetical protein